MVIFVVEADEKNVKADKGRTVDFGLELTEAVKNDRVITLLLIVITILLKSACDKQFEVLWCFPKDECFFLFCLNLTCRLLKRVSVSSKDFFTDL